MTRTVLALILALLPTVVLADTADPVEKLKAGLELSLPPGWSLSDCSTNAEADITQCVLKKSKLVFFASNLNTGAISFSESDVDEQSKQIQGPEKPLIDKDRKSVVFVGKFFGLVNNPYTDRPMIDEHGVGTLTVLGKDRIFWITAQDESSDPKVLKKTFAALKELQPRIRWKPGFAYSDRDGFERIPRVAYFSDFLQGKMPDDKTLDEREKVYSAVERSNSPWGILKPLFGRFGLLATAIAGAMVARRKKKASAERPD